MKKLLSTQSSMLSLEESQKLFDECFKARGGRYSINLSVRPEIFENVLNHSRKHIAELKKNHFPEVHIDFINNSSLNAVVSKYQNHYFIGIHIGTFYVLSDLFFRMLSSNKILSSFGNIDLEEDTKKIFNAQIVDANHLFSIKNPSEQIAPKDQERHLLAQLLTLHAIEFLVTHEYAHLIFGHIDYLNEEFNCYYWNEISEEKEHSNPLLPLVSQTLEMDADCYATKIGLLKTLYFTENNRELNASLLKFYANSETSLYLWFFSIYSLFRIFGFYNNDSAKMKETSHPLTGIRQRTVFVTATSIYLDSHLKDVIFDSMNRTINDVEMAFDEISNQGIDSTAFRISMSEAGVSHFVEIMKNWNLVRPLLEKYSYGNLAPLDFQWDEIK